LIFFWLLAPAGRGKRPKGNLHLLPLGDFIFFGSCPWVFSPFYHAASLPSLCPLSLALAYLIWILLLGVSPPSSRSLPFRLRVLSPLLSLLSHALPLAHTLYPTLLYPTLLLPLYSLPAIACPTDTLNRSTAPLSVKPLPRNDQSLLLLHRHRHHLFILPLPLPPQPPPPLPPSFPLPLPVCPSPGSSSRLPLSRTRWCQ